VDISLCAACCDGAASIQGVRLRWKLMTQIRYRALIFMLFVRGAFPYNFMLSSSHNNYYHGASLRHTLYFAKLTIMLGKQHFGTLAIFSHPKIGINCFWGKMETLIYSEVCSKFKMIYFAAGWPQISELSMHIKLEIREFPINFKSRIIYEKTK
jgi:hypothetical protein